MSEDRAPNAVCRNARMLNADTQRRYLIKGGCVLSMCDDEVAGIGDVLVEGNLIAAVGKNLHVDEGTPVIDASNMIVLPGLQDSHRHCWQTAFRRAFAGAEISRYFDAMHVRVGPVCRPEDLYLGGALASATALDGGVTTISDFAHNCRSRDHADAAMAALAASGIRAVFAYGPPLVGEWQRQWPADLTRVRDSSAPLVKVQMAVLADDGLAGAARSLSADTIRTARDAGVGIIADATVGAAASANIVALGRAGLLGPDVTLIHGTTLADEAWSVIADAGVRVCLCPTSDMQIGLGDALPPIQKVLDHGVAAGIGVDVECCLSSDLFAQMQAIFTIQRVGAFGRAYAGDGFAPTPMSTQQVLRLATSGGAELNGLGQIAGVIAPGRVADIILIRAEDINTLPLSDAVATVVLGAGPQNVDTVIVDGIIRKAGGKLLDVDLQQLRTEARASRDYLLAASGVGTLA